MKLNIKPKIIYTTASILWVITALIFYTPITGWVTNNLLTTFKPVAYVGETYELSKIDSSQFQASTESYSSGSSTYEEYSIGSDIGSLDGRAAALRKYLRDQGSPLMPYAELLVEEADNYKLDWRLVTAISGIESRFCRIRPAGTNNCWGWRGGPGGTWQVFEDLGVGVKVLTSRLALGYGTHLTPYDIEPAYCPPCAASGHHWAFAVTQYMGGMQAYLEKSRVTE